HHHVERLAIEVLAGLGPAHGGIVLGRAIGAGDDQRLAQPRAQRLELVEACRIDLHPSGALAGDFLGAEIGPAPDAGWNVLPVGIVECHDGLLSLLDFMKTCAAAHTAWRRRAATLPP